MPTARSQLAILVFAVAMATATLAVRLQRPLHTADVKPLPVTFRIDVNHADADTLCLLPGVGPGIAQHIISRRETQGRFHTADELESVRMIGTKTRLAIEPWVAFE